MSLFKKNKVNNDKQFLFEAMDRIISGDCTTIDPSVFNDPAYAVKLNQIIDYFYKRNNSFVMRLNDSMQTIGDSAIIKRMLEEVASQKDSIDNMNQSSEELARSIGIIS